MGYKICILVTIALHGLVFVSAHNLNLIIEDNIGSAKPKERRQQNIDIQTDCSIDWFLANNKSVVKDYKVFASPQAPKILLPRYEECRLNFTEKIRGVSEEMTDEERENVELLADDLIKASKGKGLKYKFSRNFPVDIIKMIESGEKKLAKRMVERLDSEKSSLEDRKGRANAVDGMIFKIKSVCQKTYEELKSIFEIFRILSHYVEFKGVYIEENSVDWLIRARMCGLILEGRKANLKNTFWNAIFQHYLDKHEPEQKLHKEWIELKTKLFTKNGANQVLPADVLIHLKRMDEILGIISLVELINPKHESLINSIKELISLGEVSETGCHSKTFQRFRLNKLFYDAYPKTILGYLKHFSAQQFELCEPGLKIRFNQAINELTQEQREDLNLFSKYSLNWENPNIQGCSNGAFRMLSVKGLKPTRKTKSEEIEEMLERSIGDLCKKVAHNHIFDFYRIIMIDEDLKNLVDQETSNWVLHYEMCKSYERNRTNVIHDIQRILSEKSSRFCGLF